MGEKNNDKKSGLINISDVSRNDLKELIGRLVETGQISSELVNAELDEIRKTTKKKAKAAFDQDDRALSLERAWQLLMIILEARFNKNSYRHEGVEWSKVKLALEANPKALFSINEMEIAGHKPDVYRADNKGFDIGTCSGQMPLDRCIMQYTHIVYDAEAAEWLRKHHPDEECNGSVIEMAEAMGVDIMDEDQYRHLQKYGMYDEYSSIWLKTLDDTREDGSALIGFRNGICVSVFRDDPTATERAFRGSLRVLWS